MRLPEAGVLLSLSQAFSPGEHRFLFSDLNVRARPLTGSEFLFFVRSV